MVFCDAHCVKPICLLLLVTAGIVKGLECRADCSSENGFCEKPGECRCRSGWQGATCEQCMPFPGCLHGTCQRPWQCICEDGWLGSQCDVDTRSCSSKPCSNNSTCIETGAGKYLCICAPGYTGQNCHLKLGPCLTNGSPCQNGGTCTDDDGQAAHSSCLCPPGFAGNFCEIDVDDCEPNPCANGGTCTDHGAGYTCTCTKGFTGPTCNHTSLTCFDGPCANGGTCLSLPAGGFHCRCRPGFFGLSCTQHKTKSTWLSDSSSSGRYMQQHYNLPSHEFHRLTHPSERELLRITMKETGRTPSPLVTRSQVICFAVLGLLTCLVVLGTTGIIFFNRCESWMANAKYSQLVRQQRDYLLRSKDGEDHSVNIILPEKIKLTNYGNHYTSI
ncbi:protein delta homolog 1 isoform X2 [Brienomyrus brachyistius]|uniref:protein delta homolog 1 isoform X2 n=1 Tax=Brienomyrus brachyistius TaxID=42636 RepID=UPI0020B44F01|nr:protein delta homolog 1 isoform X2 [Brienomyrus brachyistius]XP_048830336.1 protein delta homolog 1 isoform X2 [Brienomyrus brachyistius]